MFEFCRKSRGAVSIFLVIVLLPTLICAGMFLDISRSRLADEVINSAADLALNTVLTEYDTDLKDYYGLFASCQDASSAIEAAKQYFQDSMRSAHVATSGTVDIVDGLFGGDTKVSDMLHIRTDGDINIAPMANGALDNPAMLKRGINEFMKYRAPIHGAEVLYEKLTQSKDAVQQLESASAEAKLIEARDAFYAAEKAVMKQGDVTYQAIKEYENYINSHNKTMTDEGYLDKMSEYLREPRKEQNFEQIYKEAHIRLTMNLINTHSKDGALDMTLVRRSNIESPGPCDSFSESLQPTHIQVIDRINSLWRAIENYCDAEEKLDEAYSQIGAKNSGDWGIQYWYQLTQKCKSEYAQYSSAASEVWRCYRVAENAVTNAKPEVMDSKISRPSSERITFPKGDNDNLVTCQGVYNSLKSYYDANIKSSAENGGCSSFREIGSQIDNVDTAENRARLDLSTVSDIYNIRNELESYCNDFQKASELAGKARDEAAKMGKKIKKYKEAFDKWKTCAFSPELDHSQLATNEENGDRTLIRKLEEGGLLDLTPESADELAGRLGNISDLFKALGNSIKAMKYNNVSILKIHNYESFCEKSGLDPNSIPVDEAELRKYAEEHFSFTVEPQLMRILIWTDKTTPQLKNDYEYLITLWNHPDLKQGMPSMYKWLSEKFGAPTEGNPVTKDEAGFDVDGKDSANKADGELNDKKHDTGKAEDSEQTTGHSFSEWSGAQLPSKTQLNPVDKKISADLSKVNESAGILGQAVQLIQQGLVGLRDNLYMEDYLFSMFTFDTFDNEGAYSRLTDDQKKHVKPTNCGSMYDVQAWQTSEENLTPTRFHRDPNTNWCYGGEVEYIMYGNKSNAANKAAAYAEIYAIRYALDLSPVFRFYWNDRLLNTLAEALQTFAYIPAGATKTVACLAITAAEAGMDNMYLRAGIPVLLYKADDNDLFCNYKSVFMEDEINSEIGDGITLQYSDYLKVFMLVSLSFNENDIYLRTGDVIQANMAQATGNGDYALSKCNTHYTLQATTKINTMWSRISEVEGLSGLTDKEGWKTTTINISRGY